MNYHICRLVVSSLCVGAFGAAGFRWCSICRLQPAKRTPPLSIHQDFQTDPVTHPALNKWVTGPKPRTDSVQSLRLRNSWSQLPFPHASSWRDATALYFYLVLICLYVTEPTVSLSLSFTPPLTTIFI